MTPACLLPIKHRPTSLSLPAIESAVAAAWGLPDGAALHERTRREEIVLPRQVAMYLMREMAGVPSRAVGAHFGCSTAAACWSHRVVADRMAAYPKLKAAVEELMGEIEGKRQ